jgi:hypothetical protein
MRGFMTNCNVSHSDGNSPAVLYNGEAWRFEGSKFILSMDIHVYEVCDMHTSCRLYDKSFTFFSSIKKIYPSLCIHCSHWIQRLHSIVVFREIRTIRKAW